MRTPQLIAPWIKSLGDPAEAEARAAGASHVSELAICWPGHAGPPIGPPAIGALLSPFSVGRVPLLK